MSTSTGNIQDQITATHVHFHANTMIVTLTGNREIQIQIDQIDWLSWLANATPEQRENWSLEPGGYAIFWEDLDDGIEVCHLLEDNSIEQNNAGDKGNEKSAFDGNGTTDGM